MRAAEPSQTAVGVAVARATLDRPSTPAGDPRAEDALAASLLEDASEATRAMVERARPGGDGYAADEWAGFWAFLHARTAFFDEAVVRAIADGVTQVVICGAGYDGRSFRFRTPGVRFFEVDHPATQADKRARIERLGLATDGITFVPVDLTEPGLADALDRAGHARAERSVFVVEGLVRYLPEPWYRMLLDVLVAQAAPGSDIAASFPTQNPDEAEDVAEARREHERGLAESGEDVLTVPDRSVLLGWLADAGWTIDSLVDVSEVHPEAVPGLLLVHASP